MTSNKAPRAGARAPSEAVLFSIAAGLALGVSVAVAREQGDPWAGVALFGSLLAATFAALLLLRRAVLPALAVVTLLVSLAAPPVPVRTALASPSAPQNDLCVSQFPMPGCYDTIQAAIERARTGDTIKVAAGTYTETLVINKTLSVKGGYAHRPAFDTRRPLASALTGDIYIAGSDLDVTIDGFTLRGGVSLYSSNRVQLTAQRLDMSGSGSGFTVCSSCLVVAENVAADGYNVLFRGVYDSSTIRGSVEARHMTARNIRTLAVNVAVDLRHSIVSKVPGYLYLNSTVTETNTLRHDTGFVSFSTVSASGVITGDPKFVSGWHIGPGSPALDAAVGSSAVDDAEGHDRPQGAGRDLGADEMKARAARVLPYSQAALVLPGQSVHLPVRVENTGTQTETLMLLSSGVAWGWSVVPSMLIVGLLGPWMSTTLSYTVTAPADALYGEEPEVLLTLSSPGVSAEDGRVRLRVDRKTGLVIGPEDALSASPVITVPRGATLTVTHRLTNTGNYTESVALSAASTWPVLAAPLSLTLSPGASAPISLVVSASPAITQHIAPATLLAAGQYASATVTHTLSTSATVWMPIIWRDPSDNYEPDNSCTEFSTISVGETQTRTFAVAGGMPVTDTDIVRVTLPVTGTYTISALGDQPGAEPKVEIIASRSCNDTVWRIIINGNLSFMVEVPSGSYVLWLRVTNNNGLYGDGTRYVLKVTSGSMALNMHTLSLPRQE